MKKENLILLLLAAIQFVHVVDFMVIAPLGPQLMKLFGLTVQEFSYVFSAYTYSAGVMSFAAAFFLDRYDRKNALLFAFSGLIVGTAWCGFAQDFYTLLAARVMAGLFGGLINALIFSIVGDMFGEERRGQAMGTIMAAFSLATVLGVPIGLYLAVEFDWHIPFYSIAALGVICAIVAAVLLPQMRDHISPKIQQALTKPSPFSILSLVFKNKSERSALGLMFFSMFASFSVIPFISPFMVFNLGILEKEQSYIYFLGGIATLITAPLIGRMSDRLGKPKVFLWTAFFSAFVFVGLTVLPPVPLWGALIATTLFFVFATGRMVPAMAMITGAIPAKRRGGFMSLNASVQQITAGTASIIAGLIVQTLPDNRIQGYYWVGILAAISVFLSMWVSTYVKPAPAKSIVGSTPEAEIVN